MLCEEWTVVAGLLMGVIVKNSSCVTMKGEDFHKSVSMHSFTDIVQQFLNQTQHVYRTLHNFSHAVKWDIPANMMTSTAEPSRMDHTGQPRFEYTEFY